MIKINPKIIDQRRYNKTTKSKSKKAKFFEDEKKTKKEISKKNIEKIKSKTTNNNLSYIKLNRLTYENNLKNDKKSKLNNKNKIENENKKMLLKISVMAILLFCIGVISKKIYEVKNTPNGLSYVNSNTGKTVYLTQDYSLNIGISKLDTISFLKSKNVISNELYKLSSLSLVNIDTSYNITYNVAKSITKNSNKEYEIIIDKEKSVLIDEIKDTVYKILDVGEENVYYNYLKNIDSIKKASNEKMIIYLKDDDPYFIYKLDFPIITSSDNTPYKILTSDDTSVTMDRNKKDTTLKQISFTSFNDSDDMVDAFVKNKIDVFTASSDSIMTLVGKHDYSVKKYRDGKTIFLLFNPSSDLTSKKEVRQALLYSLNRNEILTNSVGDSFYELIDIPYIYSNIKYKYDTYGVQTTLLSQGWIKSSGLYQKNENDKTYILELRLLVNSNDNTKLSIAENIKQMAENSGIKINITPLDGQKLNDAISNKEYDIVLADISLNQVPDISFIEDYLKVNDIVKSAINIYNDSSIEDMQKNLSTLQDTLSSEVACIGIAARNVNVVYQSYITGFENLNYMHIYDNIKYIGKIQDTSKN